MSSEDGHGEEPLNEKDARKKFIEEQKQNLKEEALKAEREEKKRLEQEADEEAKKKDRDLHEAEQREAQKRKDKLAAAIAQKYKYVLNYADDSTIYQNRISVEQRYEYWQAVQRNKVSAPTLLFPLISPPSLPSLPFPPLHPFLPFHCHLHTQVEKKPHPKFRSWKNYMKSLEVTSEIQDYALPRRVLLNFLVHVVRLILFSSPLSLLPLLLSPLPSLPSPLSPLAFPFIQFLPSRLHIAPSQFTLLTTS